MSDLSLGSVIYTSVKPIFKIYFIIALGFFLAKKNILTVTTCRDISDTVVTAMLPCLIFENIVGNLKSSDIKNIGIIFFTGTILFTIGAMTALVTYFVTKSPRRWLGGLLSVGLFPNISDLPIAYLQTFEQGGIFPAAEGSKGVAYVCIFLMTQVLYQFSLGLYRLIEWDFKEELQKRDLENNTSDEFEKASPVSSGNTSDHDHMGNTLTVPKIHCPEEAIANDDESIASDSAMPMKRQESTTTTNDETAQHRAFLQARGLDKIISNGSSIQSPPASASHRRAGSMSAFSISSDTYSLRLTPSRTAELRKLKSQDITDVINEYSEFEALKNHEMQRCITGTSEVGIEPVTSPDIAPSTFKEKA